MSNHPYWIKKGMETCLFLNLTLFANACSNGIAANTSEKKVIRISIGTQDQVINTATGGPVIREKQLLEKYLPTTGKYKDTEYKVEWSSYTSGPPITNKMVAGQIDIGMMGDFPTTINLTTFQKKGGDVKSLYIATLAYSPNGAGNAIVVPKGSPYQTLADLKGKDISVPFGSAAHGMLLNALKKTGLDPEKDVNLTSQAPEVGGSSLRSNQIDAHADFVPYGELFVFRGFARKIFDGAQTGVPTFHGVVVRSDFAEKYPEVVIAYLKALLEANATFRKQPEEISAEVEKSAGVDKEVVYIFLGPSGLQTIDPTIRQVHLDALKNSVVTLKQLGKLDASVNPDDVTKLVDESYLRQAMKEMGVKYDDVVADGENNVISGNDALTKEPIKNPKMAAQLWVDGENKIMNFASIQNMLTMSQKLKSSGKTISATFVHDQKNGWKLFADNSLYVKDGNNVSAFLLEEDANKFAAKSGTQMTNFVEIQKLHAQNAQQRMLIGAGK